MTEFEMATLAVQRMDVPVAAVVGFSKCVLIGGGLVIMRRDLSKREKTLDALVRSGRANREEARKERDEFLKSA